MLPIFKTTTKGDVAEAWFENMCLCFELQSYSSNKKSKLVVYQLKERITIVNKFGVPIWIFYLYLDLATI